MTITASESRPVGRRSGSQCALAPLVGRFLAHGAPRAELVTFAVAALGRGLLAVGGYGLSLGEAALVLGLIAAMPFAEWVLHASVLHARPFRVAGKTFVTAATKAHAAHHADPHNEALVVTPVRALLPAGAVTVGIVALLPSWSLRTTAITALALLALTAEATHYCVHASTAPQSAWLRRRTRAHRLHHFRNDRYWFGLTTGIADALFGTGPARDAVDAGSR